ncbi:FHA domain-containing protein [Luteitalea pratensis]|uniref:FHA domain-containing protein n=1 Tax=Luteitalea pratensis TaxID=1855912 RepID=UPI000D73B79D
MHVRATFRGSMARRQKRSPGTDDRWSLPRCFEAGDRDEATIEDLGSKNGTFVDDRRIEAVVRLVDGDVIRLGAIRLTFNALRTWGSTVTEPPT